jgi:hypothetical protein
VVTLQYLFTETSADLTNSLELFRVAVIACEQECTVNIGSLSLPVVSAYNDKIQGVPNASKIVLFQL